MNSDIKIDGKDIFYRSWFEKGILTIRDMLNEPITILMPLSQFS